MREILFRGQTRKKGEKVRVDGRPVESNWVYGGIFHQNDRGGSFSVIYSYDPVEKHVVYADTVGQFTGVSDKNGAKIFEGDIVKQVFDFGLEITAEAVFREGAFGLSARRGGTTEFTPFANICNCAFEVLGNIFDNPELLGKG